MQLDVDMYLFVGGQCRLNGYRIKTLLSGLKHLTIVKASLRYSTAVFHHEKLTEFSRYQLTFSLLFLVL